MDQVYMDEAIVLLKNINKRKKEKLETEAKLNQMNQIINWKMFLNIQYVKDPNDFMKELDKMLGNLDIDGIGARPYYEQTELNREEMEDFKSMIREFRSMR